MRCLNDAVLFGHGGEKILKTSVENFDTTTTTTTTSTPTPIS